MSAATTQAGLKRESSGLRVAIHGDHMPQPSPAKSPIAAAAIEGAFVSGMPAYEVLVAEAEADYSAYWARLAREFISWKTPFTRSLDDTEAPFYKWFADGTLNVSYNCLDRQVERGLGDKIAIIFEADDGRVSRVSYRDLLELRWTPPYPRQRPHREGEAPAEPSRQRPALGAGPLDPAKPRQRPHGRARLPPSRPANGYR
jgi:hypothetical protein